MNTIKGGFHNSWLYLIIVLVLAALGLIVVGHGWAANHIPEQAVMANCNTIISDNIANDTTWTEAGSPYCIHAWVQVFAGKTLTIQPGVSVYFGSQSTALDVLGTLIAEGNETKGILFSSESDTPRPGDWARLYVPQGGTASLAYCEISYGGSYDNAGFRTDTSAVTVSHCNIHHNQGSGVLIFGGDASPTISDSTIDSNTGAGIYIRGDFNTFHNQPILQNLTIQNNAGAAINLQVGESGNYTAFPSFTNLVFSGNGSDALNMDAGGILFNLTLDSLASFNGSPILANGQTLAPQPGYTLTLNPGTTLQFSDPQGRLLVVGDSTVIATGTTDHPVTFEPDPARMQPGAWQGIKVWAGGHLSLGYCDIGYAGQDGMGLRIETSDVHVSNCRIHDNSGDGVYQWGDYAPVLEDTQIDHNTGAAIHELPNGYQYNVPTYHNLTFSDNGSNALNLGYIYLQTNRTLDGPGSFNGAPIIILEGIMVNSDVSILTFSPGTMIQFDLQTAFIQGKLLAEGTATHPITFTSDKAIPQPGDWGGIQPGQGSHLSFCDVKYGGAFNQSAVSIGDINVQVHNCHIQYNAGAGLKYDYSGYYGPETAHYENLALTDNIGAGLFVGDGSNYISHLSGVHLTLARNGVGGIYVNADSTAVLTNTIVANNAVGAYVEGDLDMAITLWDTNGTKYQTVGDGSFNEAGAIEGAANFMADGYHIQCTSAAINQGLDLIPDDIDGDPRPWPPGSLPDLGADESPCGEVIPFTAEKLAFNPEWFFDPVENYSHYRQQYLLVYSFSGGNPLSVAISDTLPNGLNLASQSSNPVLQFNQQGQELSWTSYGPVPPNTVGLVNVNTDSTSLPPGTVLTNTAIISVGGNQADLQVSTKLPLVAPMLTSSGDGETCKGKFPLNGLAQPGTTVEILVNDVLYDQVFPDPNGVFTATLDYPSMEDWTVAARACIGMDCSAYSDSVLFTPQLNFWCPRQTVWESPDEVGGTRLFKDSNGLFSTVNPQFLLNRFAYMYDNLFTVAIGNYPLLNGKQAAAVTPPDMVQVEINGVYYSPIEQIFPPNFDYILYLFTPKIPTGSMTFHVCIHAWYSGVEYVSCIMLYLTDPDGTVFDVTQGFNPDDPAQTAVSGITVTCMVSEPIWGGWVPWPAKYYNNQVNPQVTGDDGYYGFFTPPGFYYLQVDGKPGYESWRSPVIEVITQVVHVNVPLTPYADGTVHWVTLTPQGIVTPTIDIQVGDSIEWQSTLDPGDIGNLVGYMQNPVLRPLSDLDPQSSNLAWDGGMLAPGQTYRRQFVQAGTFSYTDGMGHTGTVIVHGPVVWLRRYLPLIRR